MSRRRAWSGKVLKSVLLGVLISLSTIFQGTPITPRGVQCPTAPIQAVSEVVFTKNCCGKLVAKTIQRKPREGEASFLQCRCAEERAADAQQRSDSAGSSRFAVIAILGPIFEFRSCSDLNEKGVAIVSIDSAISVDEPAPTTPPPQFI